MSDVAVVEQPGLSPGAAVGPEQGELPPVPRKRRFRRRSPYLWLALAVLAALVLARSWQASRGTPAPETLDEGLYEVAEALDGGTLRLANGAIVRLIGADAPHTAAATFTRRLVADQPVRLVFDRERLDRQGHFLAYVYVGERFLNEELVRAGLARVQMRPSFSAAKKRILDKAEQEARKSCRGLWSVAQHP